MSKTLRVSGIVLTVLLLGAIGAMAQDTPKADLFFGYSFLRYNSAQTVPAFTANGGIGTLGFNVNDHVGLEVELGGYHNGNINNYHFDNTTFSFLFGPRLSAGRSKKVDPYFHVLFGGQHGASSIAADSILVVNPVVNAPSTSGRYKGSQTTFAMAVGGGIDIKLGKAVTFRPVQVDYYLTRFEAPEVVVPADSNLKTARNQNNFRYAAGIMFTFGGERPSPPPPPPAMKSCPDGSSIPASDECPKRNLGLGLRAPQAEVCQGAAVSIAPAVNVPDGATYQWTVNDQPISQGPTFEFGTNGREPGTYKVGLRLSAPGYNDESAETTMTVLAYQPPSGSLRVSPSEIWAGDKATLSANFTPSRCGGAVRSVQYGASEGSVGGTEYDSSGVQFDPTGSSEQRKTVTLTANAKDDMGSGSATAEIVVKKAAVAAKRFPDIVFPSGKARVNNCGKRVLLEEMKPYLDKSPSSKVVLVGHTSEKEPQSAGLDQKRALNAAAVISAGQGVCSNFPASQILVSGAGPAENGVDLQPYFCGTSAVAETPEIPGQGVREADAEAKYRRVEVWLVPGGGTLPASLKDNQDAASLGVSGLGCPK